MAYIVRGESSSLQNPALDLWTSSKAGMLVDAYAVSFRVLDYTDPAKPEQVFPVSGLHTVDLVADRIGVGHYVANYTPTTIGPDGTGTQPQRIEWTYQLLSTDTPRKAAEDFELLTETPPFATALGSSGYCFLKDLLDEGATEDSRRLLELVGLSSRLIDRLTGQFFEPRAMTFTVDGASSQRLDFGVPIIAIERVTLTNASEDVDPSGYRVYARQMQGLLSPDDRADPRIKYIHQQVAPWSRLYSRATSLTWPVGEQNVEVAGVFGYTDPHPFAPTQGVTPALIRHACKLMVFRSLPKMSDRAGRQYELVRSRLMEERTRDQSYRLGPGPWGMAGASSGAGPYLTGDEEIDAILMQFMAPLQIGMS